jgi:pimeloyl-ACP methyl ester carboxylesterase
MQNQDLPDWTLNHLQPDENSPEWFKKAVKMPVTSSFVTVDDCPIHYLTWVPNSKPSNPTKKSLLFVHGGGAHANWWRFVAPSFTGKYKVSAIDLSGMGNSGKRKNYSAAQRAKEILQVLKSAELSPNPIIIGHSFGGLMTMRFAADFGEQINGAIIVDSPVLPESEKASEVPRRVLSVQRYYPTFEIGLERFRLLPAQECKNKFIVDFIARHSLVETDMGWTWKFDVKAMGANRWSEPFHKHLASMKCRSALVVAEKSGIVSKVTAGYMSDLMGKNSPLIVIKDSYHHIMLDQPIAFIKAITKQLDEWHSSESFS